MAGKLFFQLVPYIIRWNGEALAVALFPFGHTFSWAQQSSTVMNGMTIHSYLLSEGTDIDPRVIKSDGRMYLLEPISQAEYETMTEMDILPTAEPLQVRI